VSAFVVVALAVIGCMLLGMVVVLAAVIVSAGEHE